MRGMTAAFLTDMAGVILLERVFLLCWVFWFVLFLYGNKKVRVFRGNRRDPDSDSSCDYKIGAFQKHVRGCSWLRGTFSASLPCMHPSCKEFGKLGEKKGGRNRYCAGWFWPLFSSHCKKGREKNKIMALVPKSDLSFAMKFIYRLMHTF